MCKKRSKHESNKVYADHNKQTKSIKVSEFSEEKYLVESKMNVVKINSVETTFKLSLLKLSQMCKRKFEVAIWILKNLRG